MDNSFASSPGSPRPAAGDNPLHEPISSPLQNPAQSADGSVTVEVKTNDGNATELSASFAGYIARGRRSRLVHPPPPSAEAPKTLGDHPLGEEEGDDGGYHDAPQGVDVRRDPEEDGYSYAHMWRSRYSIIAPIYIAIKTAALVTLPMCILAFSPQTKNYFKASSLIAVVSTSNTKLFLGQQLAGTVMVLQGAAWMLIWGTLVVVLGINNHEEAWWTMAFAAIVFVSFFTNLRSRRLLMSYTLIVMQLIRAPGGDRVDMAAQVAGDLCMCLCVAAFQAFVPYPLLVARRTDVVFERCWKQVASISSDLRHGVWSGRAFSGNVAASERAVDDLMATTSGIPGMLFFISYEPFESSLYNQLRNERLGLLKRQLVLLRGTCTAARFFTSMSSSETRGAQRLWKDLLRETVDEFMGVFAETMSAFGKSLDPKETLRLCPFDRLDDARERLVHRLQHCRKVAAQSDILQTDAPAFYSFLYFHLLVTLMAEEMHTFRVHLEEFDARKYKSTWRRFLEFFFLDFWDDFRLKLLDRVLLKTPADRRSLKEGLKLACAYLVAVAFTMRLNSADTGNTYFFGMSIILGMGLPTASESIEVGVHRIAGLAFALCIGYIARWKTETFVQEIAVVVCGSFVALCFRDNKRYMHVAWYASFIAPAAYSISANRIQMISRLVDNCFAVMSYFIICNLMFPINPFRVLWNKRAITCKRFAETITMAASLTALPINAESRDVALAKIQIATDNLRVIHQQVADSKTWIGVCAKEPCIIGGDFPTDSVSAMNTLTEHMAAGLEIWVFGLQLLHRARMVPIHPLAMHMLEQVNPIILDIEKASRAVFQDLIDCVVDPRAWSMEASLRHFNDFVMLKGKLDATFFRLHQDMSQSQDTNLRRSMALPPGVTYSFATRANVGQDPSNYRVVPDYGENVAAGGTGVPIFDPDAGAERRNSDGEGGGGGGGGALASTTPMDLAVPNKSFNLSFRAPQGNLPIDVDVTAFTIVIMSVATFAASLELMVPLMTVCNKFAKERTVSGAFTLKDFFLCRF